MLQASSAKPMIACRSIGLKGDISVPGDKSMSHRALILATLAVGRSEIFGLLEGEDVIDTAKAMRLFGAEVNRLAEGHWEVYGVGVGGLLEPENIIDCGNSGTGVRLIMGMMASAGISATFTGDASLRKRPMGRITDPMAEIGAQAYGRRNGGLPLTLVGAANPVPVRYEVPMPSAQVKSAVLLAGLNCPGETIVIESVATRDHTERMLRGFGAQISVEEQGDGRIITLQGQPELRAQKLVVPSDPSSAAFPVAAALMVEGSDIILRGVGMNPTRNGLFTSLIEMGADLRLLNEREEGGEPVADIHVRYADLHGVDVPPERAASMIDEYPVLAALAATASGKTIMRGVKELRVKESDRIDAMARGLEACGVTIEEEEDMLTVHGLAGPVPGGALVATHLDHRIGMSFLCLGLAAKNPITLDDGRAIATSFPSFVPLMCSLGAQIEEIPS